MRRSRRVFTLVVAFIVLEAGYFGFSHWPQVQTFVWHLRQGNSIRVGNYEIQVPQDWLVMSESEGYAALINTAKRGRESTGLNPNPIITVMANPLASSGTIRDLDYWKSSEQRWLEHEGVRNVEEHGMMRR
jgi:hypothetical protein